MWKNTPSLSVSPALFIFPFPKTSSAGSQGPLQHACLPLGPMCSGLRMLMCQPEWQSPDGNDAHSLLSRVSGSFDVSGVWRGPNSRQMRRSVFPVLMILIQLSVQNQADPVSTSPSANPTQGARPGHC